VLCELPHEPPDQADNEDGGEDEYGWRHLGQFRLSVPYSSRPLRLSPP
jgi:hypothetical protein